MNKNKNKINYDCLLKEKISIIKRQKNRKIPQNNYLNSFSINSTLNDKLSFISFFSPNNSIDPIKNQGICILGMKNNLNLNLNAKNKNVRNIASLRREFKNPNSQYLSNNNSTINEKMKIKRISDSNIKLY